MDRTKYNIILTSSIYLEGYDDGINYLNTPLLLTFASNPLSAKFQTLVNWHAKITMKTTTDTREKAYRGSRNRKPM